MSCHPRSSFMYTQLLSAEILAGVINNMTQSTSKHSGSWTLHFWEVHATLMQAIAVTTQGKLGIVDVTAREPGKTYAMWNGKAVEVRGF